MTAPRETEAGGSAPGLPFGLRWSVFLRSLALQASWNHQRMQNLGLLACLVPWLRARDRDLERDRMFCRRYYEFFNTNPYLAGYLIGGLLRLEQQREDAGGLPRGQAQTFRDSLGRAFASLGDQLFWLGLRPAAVLLGCLLVMTAGFAGAAALTVLVLGAISSQLWWRWAAVGRGYALGYGLVDLLGDRRWHRAIAGAKRATVLFGSILAGWLLRAVWEQSVGWPPAMSVGVLFAALALPSLARRRWSGEFIVLGAGVLGVVLFFALGTLGG